MTTEYNKLQTVRRDHTHAAALFQAYAQYPILAVFDPQSGLLSAWADILPSASKFALYRREGWRPRRLFALRVIQ